MSTGCGLAQSETPEKSGLFLTIEGEVFARAAPPPPELDLTQVRTAAKRYFASGAELSSALREAEKDHDGPFSAGLLVAIP